MRALLSVCLAMTLLAGAVGSLSGADAPLTIQSISSPAARDSAQPQLSVSDRGVILSWIERTGTRATLKFAERTPSGWTAPRTVASGDDWFVNWADVPSVVRLANGDLVAHWLQKSGPDAYAYDVRLSYSNDNGAAWVPSFTPHRDGTKTEHGFASLVQMPGAGLGLVWLDGRAMKPGSAGSHGEPGGDMSLRFASFDSRWTQTAEVPVDLRVCECCPTAATLTSEGVIVAFRDRGADELRNIHVSRLVNGRWTEPAAVHDDEWRIAACPVNGPALSARDRDVAIAWFTVQDDQGRAFVAFSNDAGRSFGPPTRIDDEGSLGRVDVELMPDGSAAASWIEFAGGRAQFRMRRVERSGSKSAAMTIAAVAGNRTSGYPRMASDGHELVFAWTESGATSTADTTFQVRTAFARVPRATEP